LKSPGKSRRRGTPFEFTPGNPRMAGLIFIIPILAFDVWLIVTTGGRQVRQWVELKRWKPLAATLATGIALAVWLTFFIRYGTDPKMRVEGFPVPLKFFHLEDQTWTQTQLPSILPYAGLATNLVTGLVLPLFPFKVREFLQKVKAELK
jgi:hypothetical protein